MKSPLDVVFEVSPEAFARLMKSFEDIAVLDDYSPEPEDDDSDGFYDLEVDDGQPTEWEEWQDVHGGDDGFDQWEVNY